MDQWNSIKNTIPKPLERVIICINQDYDINDHVQFGVFAGSEKLNRFTLDEYTILDDEVTHWMKEPSLPGRS